MGACFIATCTHEKQKPNWANKSKEGEKRSKLENPLPELTQRAFLCLGVGAVAEGSPLTFEIDLLRKECLDWAEELAQVWRQFTELCRIGSSLLCAFQGDRRLLNSFSSFRGGTAFTAVN